MLLLLFAGALIVLFFGCLEFQSRQKKPLHSFIAINCFSASYKFLYDWAFATGLLQRFPLLAGTDIAALFIATPGYYIAARAILHEGARSTRSDAAYFIGPVVLGFVSIVYGAFAGPAYQKEFGGGPGHFSILPLCLLDVLAASLFFLATALNLLAARRLHKAGRITQRAEFRGQVAILFGYLVGASIFISSFIFKDEKIYSAGLLACCFVMIAYALTHSAVSFFAAGRFRTTLRRASLREEWDETGPVLAVRLEKLMQSEAPYRDERLTLPGLAAMVGVEPKRLSYHFQAYAARSFRGYINEWRLKSVGKELLASPDRSILDVAFENGFNSKSSFNTLFFERYGMTPREYRRKNLGGPTPK